VFAWRRLRQTFAGRWTRQAVVEFHTAEKYLLLAHGTVAYRELGRLVAAISGLPRKEFAAAYQDACMAAMCMLATPAKHTNVLQHMAGFFKDRLESTDRSELADLIHDYRNGLVPLIMPLTLIRHHVRRLGVDYLQGQRYLQPHPKELMLRNHV